MASYLDNINWRMTGTDNNKFDIPHCTFREILQHSMYLSKGYNAAKFKSNMTKRIWYHKELKLMMIQYLNVEKTEDKKEEDDQRERDNQNEEDNPNEEDNQNEPAIEEPPTKDQETEDFSNAENLTAQMNDFSSTALLENIDELMAKIHGDIPDLGILNDTLLFPKHTSTPKHEPEKREIFQCIKDRIYVKGLIGLCGAWPLTPLTTP